MRRITFEAAMSAKEKKAVQMVVHDHLRLADLLELLTMFKIDFVGGFLRHGRVRVF